MPRLGQGGPAKTIYSMEGQLVEHLREHSHWSQPFKAVRQGQILIFDTHTHTHTHTHTGINAQVDTYKKTNDGTNVFRHQHTHTCTIRDVHSVQTHISH